MKRHGMVFSLYSLFAILFTFSLILRMNSSVYGIYDHATTDLFAVIYQYFWWIPHAPDPLWNTMFHAPEGERMLFANATGFIMAPVSLLFGHLFAYNLTILLNLVLSAFGMYLLMTHITKSRCAGFISGIAFGFCTNMLVRSYTTFDSTQVQWIPLYALYVIKYYQVPAWRNAILAGVFLTCNVLFAMPYYLVWLPFLTVILLAACIGKHMPHWRWWIKPAAVLSVVLVVFAVYYFTIIGGTSTFAGAKPWGTADLSALSLKPLDYVVPHPRQLIAGDTVKADYWDAVPRPERNADSNVAQIGLMAFILSIYGVAFNKGRIRWFFFAVALVAFWSTLTPYSPSGLILKYAPFARRILLYKVFVQFGVAGLAGMGTAWILTHVKRKTFWAATISLFMLLDYAIVPPALSVDLAETPEVYRVIKALPDDSIILELPLNRGNGNMYQGYMYYQTFHHKRLFNSMYGPREIPGLAELQRLGVTHIVYHYFIGTKTVIFRSNPIPAFEQENIPGLRKVYSGPREFAESYQSPYDYGFADVYEIERSVP